MKKSNLRQSLCINEVFAEKIIQCTSNICFPEEINSHLSKASYEYQALALIKLVFGECANGFIKSESPDLQNLRTKVGIEVVTSYPESFNKVNVLEKKLSVELKNGNTEKAKSIKKQIEETGFKVLDNRVLYPAHSSIETNTFYNAVRLKSKKIKSYKSRGFQRVGLFVWHRSPVVTDFVDDLPKEWSLLLKEGSVFFEQQFDFIIVVIEHTLLFFNKNYECEKEVKIPDDLFDCLPTFGRMAAEKIPSAINLL